MPISNPSFRVSFSLDEKDARYFRSLFQKAKKATAGEDPESIISSAHDLVRTVKAADRVPGFVHEAIETLQDLTEIVEDADWAPPKRIATQVLTALAYFSNPEDLIPDHIPVLGFLDDAIMIKIIEQEFKHELAGYRRFRRFRDGAEQRPWTGVARQRLPKRLKEQRAKLRAQIDEKVKSGGQKDRRFRFF
ncbi:MAG: YkvA family protein [Myxococcota bacterium]